MKMGYRIPLVQKAKCTYLEICGREVIFDIPHPLEPVNSYHYPDLYYHRSGWLIAYPIEIFYRPNNVDLKKAIKKLKKESKEFGVIPFVKYWSGNYSFGVRLKTKNPTKENQKIYKALKHLKSIDWSGGSNLCKSSN